MGWPENDSRDVKNSDVPFTSFDFSSTPNGALPTNDALGNPFYLELGTGGANAVPLVDNGALRTTGIAVGTPTAFYLGTKQNGVIYEMGCKAILGDGVLALLISQGQMIFSNPNWAMHLKISNVQAVYEVYVANSGVIVKKCGYNLSKTVPHDIVVKFRENTAYLFINGVYVLEATDSRISSFSRFQAIFEPFQNTGNVAYTRLISGYVKTSKQASSEITGIVNPPARQVEVVIASLVTLTGAYQQILGNTAMPNIAEAMVTVRMRLDQTSAGDILIDVRGFTVNAVTTNNITVLSKTIKDDIVEKTVLVKGIGGGWLQVWVMGAFGSIPATGANDKMLVSVVPTAWTD